MLAPVSFALVGAALVAGYLGAPVSRSTELLAALVPALGAVAVLVALVVRRPTRPVPGFLIATGLLGLAAGAAGRAFEWYGDTGQVFPGAAAAVGVLAYPSLMLAALGLGPAGRRGRQLLGGSESIIYAAAGTALIWLAVTGPYLDDRSLPLARDAWIWLFPLLDGLIALAVLRALDGADATSRSFGLLAFGFLVLGAGHGLANWSASNGDLDGGTPVAAGPLLGAVVIAVAVIAWTVGPVRHPIDEPGEVQWSQLIGVLVAALVPLVALIVTLALGLSTWSSFAVVVSATLVVVVIALARMWRLVDQVQVVTEQRGRRRLAAMVGYSSDVVLFADLAGRVTYASPGLGSTLGHRPERWEGRPLLDLVVDDERAEAVQHIEQLRRTGSGETVEFDISVVHADGQHRRASVVVAHLIERGMVAGIVATFRDVTEQRNLERQLSHRAFHDPLTGLANRALFLDRMDHALRVTRSLEDPVMVLFVDLDDFKSVNDTLGHDVGDQLLKIVADRIRRSAGSGDTAARMGGDEFAVLMEDRGGVDRAIDVAERLLESLREPVSIDGYEIAVLASVGVAVATQGVSTTSVLRDADIAMYEAKRAGKGQIRIFDPAMRLAATRHLEYRTDLGQALAGDQVRLVYLPYVDLRSGEVTGAEALARWRHPDQGDLSASDFVPIAERSGLIVDLGYRVLELALAQLETWRPGLYLSVNLSTVQMRQPDFVERVLTMVATRRVDPRSVVFEITEEALVDEAERAGRTLELLRAEGFRFAIDDFGSGACSLGHLQRQPVDVLKIDRAAVAAFGDDPGGPTLARTILQTAESLGLLTVGEGIETIDELRELRRAGCDLGQGHLLSHPLEADELARRFASADLLGAP